MERIVIIGAGMAGIGAAYFLSCRNLKSIVFDKNNYYGGKAATFKSKNGFIFDNVPHVLYTKTERLKRLLCESVNKKYKLFSPYINNYWKGKWIKHPVQVNLFGLPTNMVIKIINEFSKGKQENAFLANNFKEWLYAVFGETFSETFPIRYSDKYHTTEAENIDLYEIKSRFYHPSFNEVLFGALSRETENVHYLKNCYYPTEGGFIRFLDKIIPEILLKLDHKVTSIDPDKKYVVFNNGKIEKYDYLISSIPLPELIKIITGVPKIINKASERLAYTSCVLVNLGIKSTNLSKAHWTYFYDHDIIFSKLTFPHLLSPQNTPEDCESVQAEIYFSKKYKPLYLKPEFFIDPVIAGLIRCGIIEKENEVIYKEAKLIPYANIIIDFDRKSNLKVVHKYLTDLNIKYCGRYGDWENKWAEESFLSGESAALSVIKELISNHPGQEDYKRYDKYYW